MKPIKLKPVYKKTIWASDRISKIRSLQDREIGISREVSAYKGTENIVESGEHKGKLITEVIQKCHDELMQNDESDQLIRVAYMGSSDDLSIQVHPNQDIATKLNDYEKSESWYILEAKEGASIFAGIDTLSKEKFVDSINSGQIEKYLHRIPVKEGDFVTIPAGLVHANGKDMLVLEIGSYGGITYRLYDFGRGRELHVDESYEVLNFDLKPSFTYHPFVNRTVSTSSVGADFSLFHVDVVDVVGQYDIPISKQYYIITCVKNNCRVVAEEEEIELNYTDTLLIPSSCKSTTIKGNCRVLLSYKRMIV